MPYGLKGLFINGRNRWAVLRTKALPASGHELPSPWQILSAAVAVRTTAEALRRFGQSCNGAWLEWCRQGRLQTPECRLRTQQGRLRDLLKPLRKDFFCVDERSHSVCQRDLGSNVTLRTSFRFVTASSTSAALGARFPSPTMSAMCSSRNSANSICDIRFLLLEFQSPHSMLFQVHI